MNWDVKWCFINEGYKFYFFYFFQLYPFLVMCFPLIYCHNERSLHITQSFGVLDKQEKVKETADLECISTGFILWTWRVEKAFFSLMNWIWFCSGLNHCMSFKQKFNLLLHLIQLNFLWDRQLGNLKLQP